MVMPKNMNWTTKAELEDTIRNSLSDRNDELLSHCDYALRRQRPRDMGKILKLFLKAEDYMADGLDMEDAVKAAFVAQEMIGD